MDPTVDRPRRILPRPFHLRDLFLPITAFWNRPTIPAKFFPGDNACIVRACTMGVKRRFSFAVRSRIVQ